MKTILEINEKYEIYTQLEYEYSKEILLFIDSLIPHHSWRQDYEIDNCYFFIEKDDHASYRIEYRFGWNNIHVRTHFKKDGSLPDDKLLTPEDFKTFYKKLTTFKNFK